MSAPVFVAFDVETTGLVAGVDRVVEMAAVAFRGEEILEVHSALVNPGVAIPEEVTRVNGITNQMIAGCPPPAAVLEDFLAVLRRGTPVAHNAPFDVGFVLAEADEAGGRLPAGPVLDTRALARAAFPNRAGYGLSGLLRELNLPPATAHRALGDAHACRQLFCACLSRLGSNAHIRVEDLVLLCGDPLDFGPHAPRQPRIARLLQGAIREGSAVQITYRSADGETTSRIIMPLSFTCVGRSPAVRAYCTLRNQNRTFFLGSISEARAP